MMKVCIMFKCHLIGCKHVSVTEHKTIQNTLFRKRYDSHDAVRARSVVY